MALALAGIMGAVAVSGGTAGVIAATNETPVLASLGFEVVVLVTGIAGLLFALRRDETGRAVGLLNLGGVLLVASLTARFAWHTTVNPDAIGVGKSARFALSDPWFVVRGLIGAALMAWSVLVALGTQAVGWRRLVSGGLLATPLLAVLAYGLKSGFGGFFPAMVDTASAIRAVGAVIATLVLSVMFAAGVHLVIKAFEMAVPHHARQDPSQQNHRQGSAAA